MSAANASANLPATPAAAVHQALLTTPNAAAGNNTTPDSEGSSPGDDLPDDLPDDGTLSAAAAVAAAARAGAAVAAAAAMDLDAAVPGTPATPSAAGHTPQKERHSLTLDQRRALRRWANTQGNRPSHKQCIEWFQRQYHQTISQSTVSHSLSPKYARLDGEPQLSGSRLRFGNWPEVEKLVLLWYQQMAATGHHPTNEELADKAKAIFTQLPRHRGEEPPEFSPGWIHRFKKRYGLLIRRQRRQSALGSDGMAPPPPPDGSTDVSAPAPAAPAAVPTVSVPADPASDIAYLAEAVRTFFGDVVIGPGTSPVAIRDAIHRSLGVAPSLATCVRVRDEIVNYSGAAASVAPPGLGAATTSSEASAANAAAAAVVAAAAAAAASAGFSSSRDGHVQPQPHAPQPEHASNGAGSSSTSVYPNPDEDPEMVLQHALRQLQQQEEVEVAEAAAAVAAAAGTAVDAAEADARMRAEQMGGVPATPSRDDDGAADRPLRCPFCVNQRMLRSIKEAVEHMSSHVVM